MRMIMVVEKWCGGERRGRQWGEGWLVGWNDNEMCEVKQVQSDEAGTGGQRRAGRRAKTNVVRLAGRLGSRSKTVTETVTTGPKKSKKAHRQSSLLADAMRTSEDAHDVLRCARTRPICHHPMPLITSHHPPGRWNCPQQQEHSTHCQSP